MFYPDLFDQHIRVPFATLLGDSLAPTTIISEHLSAGTQSSLHVLGLCRSWVHSPVPIHYIIVHPPWISHWFDQPFYLRPQETPSGVVQSIDQFSVADQLRVWQARCDLWTSKLLGQFHRSKEPGDTDMFLQPHAPDHCSEGEIPTQRSGLRTPARSAPLSPRSFMTPIIAVHPKIFIGWKRRWIVQSTDFVRLLWWCTVWRRPLRFLGLSPSCHQP